MYSELQNSYASLEESFNSLTAEADDLKAQLQPLIAFKKASEKKEKEAMINSFYMLSDDDKADVIANIDTYSLDDIEAKLSIICVRNRVTFDDNSNSENKNDPLVYNLNNNNVDDSTSAWVKAAIAVAEKKL